MNEHEDPRDELEDRWTDQALAEVVGGKRPPDLTARILAAARPRRFALRPRMKLALAASLLVAVSSASTAFVVSRQQKAIVVDVEQFEAALASYKNDRGGGFSTDALETPGERTADRSHAQDRHNGSADETSSDETNDVTLAERTQVQEKLDKLVHEFNTLMDERRYAEAEVIAKRAYELAPNELVVAQLRLQVKMVKRTRDVAGIRGEKEQGFYQALTEVDRSAIPASESKTKSRSSVHPVADARPPDMTAPVSSERSRTDQLNGRMKGYTTDKTRLRDARHRVFVEGLYRTDSSNVPTTDEPPIHYPDPEMWQALTERRKRYKLLVEDLESRSKKAVMDMRVVDEARAELQEIDDQIIAQRLAGEGHGPGEGGDRYSRILENPFLDVTDNPLSTFSIDVDTASYAKTRRYIEQEGCLPPPDAVRIEEFVNYFSYDYAPPEGNVPFSAHVEVAACPWQPEHRLLRIGLKGKEIARDDRPAANLVFLLDVSGSMRPEDKLPRVRRAMHLLVEQLREQDRVAMVVYAAASGLVLPSTSGFQKDKIAAALDSLEAGGSTNGGDGIRLAYDTAQAGFIKGGTNRVVLCTDGDFNVGTTSTAELERLVEERAKGGVFLTVLGFGMGNHNDEMMEKLADKGNGNYGYVDSEREARKLLVEQAGGTLVTIAKDVKLQLEFNPLAVGAYRLIGYEDRLLRAEDFNDDKKDAGEIGAGHTVTALYELVPPGKPVETPEIDELKYQRPAAPTEAAAGGELLTLKLRYKDPDGEASHEPLVVVARDDGHGFAQATADFKFASAVAGFGLLLRGSEFKGNLTYAAVLELAGEGLGPDPNGHRAAFVELVKKAKSLASRP